MIRDDRRFKIILLAILMASFLFGYVRCPNPLFSGGKAVEEGFGGIDSIEVSSGTGGIRIRTEDRDDVFVVSDKIEVSSSSGRLQVKGWNADIGLTVPEAMLGKIALQSATGNIVIDSASAEKIWVDSSAGDIWISGSCAESIEASSFSGDISITGTRSTSITVDNTSGRTTIDDGSVKTVRVDTISGEISMSVPEASAISIDTVSADAWVTVRERPHSIDIDTVSGKATVFGGTGITYRMEDPELSLTFDSVSGDLDVSAY